MAVQNLNYVNTAIIVGPTPDARNACREALWDLAEEANVRAAQAFLDGHDAQGAAYLGFAERLTRLAGRRP